jgi:hypothetical protein
MNSEAPASPRRNVELDVPLLLAALGLLALAVIRAGTLAVTIDEANTYNTWCRTTCDWLWRPAANNHVLNSAFIRFFTGCFGLNIYTFRAGALFGAAFYLAACYSIALTLARRGWLRWALFLCLAANPFVQDYLSVARGYSLALGFLLSAMALALREFSEGAPEPARTVRRGVAVTVLAALSLSSNFAFAHMATMAVLFYYLLADKAARPGLLLRAVPAGAALTLVLCGWTLATWSKTELYYGARNTHEMFESLRDSTLYELNSCLVNPLLWRPFEWTGLALPHLYRWVGVLLVAGVAFTAWRKRERLPRTFLYAAGALAAAFLLHWGALRLFHVLLPKERTGVFFVPVSILAFAAAIAANHLKAVRAAGVAVLVAGAVYFCGCLRVGYTKEWRFDADAGVLYQRLRALKRPDGARDVTVNWEFHRVLEFYAQMYNEPGRFDFQGYEGGPPPAGKAVYVLPDRDYEDLKSRESTLEIVYRGELTSNVIVLGPPLAQPAAAP